MKKYPKHIVMPVAIFIYFIVMAVMNLKNNNWHPMSGFWTICLVETVIVVALFFCLRYLYKKRNQE